MVQLSDYIKSPRDEMRVESPERRRSRELAASIRQEMRRSSRQRWLTSRYTWMCSLPCLGAAVLILYSLLNSSNLGWEGGSTRAVQWKSNDRRRKHIGRNRPHQDTILTQSLLPRGQDPLLYRQSTTPESTDADPEHTNLNPTIYGWTPNQYPDPIESPIRCGIGNLNEGEGKLRTDAASNIDSNHTLRLCDPDWVLGPSLQAVAISLLNFSETVKRNTAKIGELHPSHDDDKNEENEDTADDQATITSEPNMSIQLAVATVRKMNLPQVLRSGSYYAYEDEDDMVNDAAQIFAHQLHTHWWNHSSKGGILLFLSVQDRVCFISTGGSSGSGKDSRLSYVLPWWRLDHVVSGMKPLLDNHDYGAAVLQAVGDLARLWATGPPTLRDRLHDFASRFGVVFLFAFCTFVFGAWGEYRDRKTRWQYALERSTLSDVERQKATLLQQEYRTRDCPICLDSLKSSSGTNLAGLDDFIDDDDISKPRTSIDPSRKLPARGADGKRIKILRCGHVFCDGCWKSWVQSGGCGNPCKCPVCRQDVGKNPRTANRAVLRDMVQLTATSNALSSSRTSENSLVSPPRAPPMLQPSAHPSYDSVRRMNPLRRMHPNSLSNMDSEDTPLLLPSESVTSRASERNLQDN